MSFFTRTEPARNLHRFYVVHLCPTLFGDWTLLCEWGRSGSPGRVRLTSFASYSEAEQAERQIIKRRLQHGYTETPALCSTRAGGVGLIDRDALRPDSFSSARKAARSIAFSGDRDVYGAAEGY